jgi:adenylate cyclase
MTLAEAAQRVGVTPATLRRWVRLPDDPTERPLPRIAVHYGVAMYRDGDYYGRDVNIASRMAARSAGGEVLVTRPVVDAVSAPHLEFERIGEVRLKGFSESTEVFLARQREDTEP